MIRHIVRCLGMAALAWALHVAVAFAQTEMQPDEGVMTHPASMVDCAPCVSCHMAAPGGRLATGDGPTQETQASLKPSPEHGGEHHAWQPMQRSDSLPLRVLYCRWLN